MPRWLAILLIVVVGGICGALFFTYAAPLDLWCSNLFFVRGRGFVYADRPLVEWIYKATYRLNDVIGVGLLLGLAASFAMPSLKRWRTALAFLALSMALGPGLITNNLLKDHWGRPRPSQVILFGGTHPYVAPLLMSRECEHNCSFPSGHAASAFWLITPALVFVRRRRLWWMAGLEWGALVGAVRIIQGGHFLSDVVFALGVVWLTNLALWWGFQQAGLNPEMSDAAPSRDLKSLLVHPRR